MRDEKGEMRNSNREWREKFIERLTKFSVSIILLANKLPRTPAGFAIANQLIKAGTSIGANFIEAQDASSAKDFVQKLSISLREAREVWYWLNVIRMSGLLPVSELAKELKECDEIIAVFVSSIKSAKKRI